MYSRCRRTRHWLSTPPAPSDATSSISDPRTSWRGGLILFWDCSGKSSRLVCSYVLSPSLPPSLSLHPLSLLSVSPFSIFCHSFQFSVSRSSYTAIPMVVRECSPGDSPPLIIIAYHQYTCNNNHTLLG